MNNEPSAVPHGPPPTAPTPVSAAALVGGVDPRPRQPAPPPGPGWEAPLSMSWHSGPESGGGPPEEMAITWGPTSQSLAVGSQTFVHEGPPTMYSSAGVVRL